MTLRCSLAVGSLDPPSKNRAGGGSTRSRGRLHPQPKTARRHNCDEACAHVPGTEEHKPAARRRSACWTRSPSRSLLPMANPQAPERSSSWLVSLGSGDDLVNIEDIDVIDQFVGEGFAGIELLLDHLLVEEPIVVGLIIGANTFAPALNPRLIRVKAPCLGTGFE